MENLNDQITSYLVERGVIQKEDLEKAFPSNQPLEGVSLEERLVHFGLLTEEKYNSALEQFLGVPFATQDDFPREPVLVNTLSIQFMKESKFVPARLNDKELTVIMSNPLDFYTIDAIRLATNREVRVLAGRENQILWGIEQFYGTGSPSMEKIIEDIDGIP